MIVSKPVHDADFPHLRLSTRAGQNQLVLVSTLTICTCWMMELYLLVKMLIKGI